MLKMITNMSSFSFYTALLRNTCTLKTTLFELHNFSIFFQIILWILECCKGHLWATWVVLILDSCHRFLFRLQNILAYPMLIGYCRYIWEILSLLRWLTCFHLISSLFDMNWKRIRGSILFFRLIPCILKI